MPLLFTLLNAHHRFGLTVYASCNQYLHFFVLYHLKVSDVHNLILPLQFLLFMKTNKITFSILAAVIVSISLFSFRSTAPKATQYMQITLREAFSFRDTKISRIIATNSLGNIIETVNLKSSYGISHMMKLNADPKEDKAFMVLLNKYAKYKGPNQIRVFLIVKTLIYRNSAILG